MPSCSTTATARSWRSAGSSAGTRTACRTSCTPALARLFSPEQIVALTAFGAIMLATNVFNNALRVDLDGYLEPYRGRRACRPAGGRVMARFAGKVAFITGAAHGQGRAAALALAREGARIARSTSPGRWPIPATRLGTPDDLDAPGGRVPGGSGASASPSPPTCGTTRR